MLTFLILHCNAVRIGFPSISNDLCGFCILPNKSKWSDEENMFFKNSPEKSLSVEEIWFVRNSFCGFKT